MPEQNGGGYTYVPWYAGTPNAPKNSPYHPSRYNPEAPGGSKPASGYTGGGGVGGGQGGNIQQELDAFFSSPTFADVQSQLLNADFYSRYAAGAGSEIVGLGDEFKRIGFGGADPRFAAYQQSQFDVLRANELGQLGQTADFFTRRGGGNSTAALNALNRVSGGFDLQRSGLAGQIGMQQLQRQDQSLLNAGNLYNTAGGQFQAAGALRGQELDARQAALQNYLGKPELMIALLAAQNAGKETDGGSGGVLGSFFDDIFGTRQSSKA